MEKVTFSRQQYDKEFYSMACRGLNRVSDWEGRFGFRQQVIAAASHKFYGCQTRERFKFIQLEIARDMILNSNLSLREIANLINRDMHWLSREYIELFGETVTVTRKNKLWSRFL